MIAPDLHPDAAARLASRTALRLLVTGNVPDPAAAAIAFRSVTGGILVQERDRAVVDAGALRVVTRRKPTVSEIADLLFADRVVKHVKSNAVVFASDGATVGIGAGQMSRVDSVLMAAQKAAKIGRAAGALVAPPKVPCSLPTLSSRSPMVSKPRLPRGQGPSFNPADRCATRK